MREECASEACPRSGPYNGDCLHTNLLFWWVLLPVFLIFISILFYVTAVGLCLMVWWPFMSVISFIGQGRGSCYCLAL